MSNTINFFNEEIDFSLDNESQIKNWIEQIAKVHEHSITNVNYIFCSDDYLLEINKEHLNHDFYTDIITFDISEEESKIESDMFISIDRVKENAINNNCLFETETLRVLIHGLLHLIGFDDKNDDDKMIMRKKEEECLSLYSN